MWFSLNLQLENLLEIRKKVEVALYLWLPRNPLLKWLLSVSHLPFILYWLSVLPLPYTQLAEMEGALFKLLCDHKVHTVRSSFWDPSIDVGYWEPLARITISFCTQDKDNGRFLNEDSQNLFGCGKALNRMIVKPLYFASKRAPLLPWMLTWLLLDENWSLRNSTIVEKGITSSMWRVAC